METLDIGAASKIFIALATEAQAEDEGANGANSGNDGRGRKTTIDHQVMTAILDLYV